MPKGSFSQATKRWGPVPLPEKKKRYPGSCQLSASLSVTVTVAVTFKNLNVGRRKEVKEHTYIDRIPIIDFILRVSLFHKQ
jgi:hypothetical protein